MQDLLLCLCLADILLLLASTHVNRGGSLCTAAFTNETMADGDMRFRVEVGDKFSPWARVYSRDHQ